MSIQVLSLSSDKLDNNKLRSLAKSRGVRLIGNALADKVLHESPQEFCKAWPICTSTMVAYPATGAKMDSSLEYSPKPLKFHLDTKDFKGERNIALVFDDFQLKTDGGWTILMPVQMSPLKNFPQENGWAPTEERSGIPSGFEGNNRRFLWRSANCWIGPVIRDFGLKGTYVNDVFLHHRPNHHVGALIR